MMTKKKVAIALSLTSMSIRQRDLWENTIRVEGTLNTDVISHDQLNELITNGRYVLLIGVEVDDD